MKFHLVLNSSGKHLESNSFKDVLAEISRACNVAEKYLAVRPSEDNNNLFYNVFSEFNDEPIARVYYVN